MIQYIYREALVVLLRIRILLSLLILFVNTSFKYIIFIIQNVSINHHILDN